ncbi:NAD(P)-dependent oxidoreductase [Halobacteriovorax sp.]|uniref:NAD(P)-dependent oxidoreductase n=1 Tax=Halobacteriovorax sp. TaxID=2020862 RepID=UPI003AF282BF
MTYYLYRPEISSYQGESFRVNERESLTELGIKYVDTSIEIPDNKSVIVISTSYTNNEEIKDSLSHAKIALWIHPNSGYDNFNYTFIKEAQFPIILGNEIRANAVSQFYLQSLLNHLGKIPVVKQWDDTRQYRRELINEKNILIIGKGPIGNKLGPSLKSLGATINYYDPYQDKSHNRRYFTDSIKKADILIMACSLNESSYHIINKDTFALLKENVIIMNAARGKLIDSEQLVKFLDRNRNAFAIVDVFEKEPVDFANFKHLSNIRLSSHIAGVYTGINESIIKFEKNIIREFMKDKTLEAYEFSKMKNRIKGNLLI